MANKKNLANGIVASNVGTSSGTIPLIAGYGAAMPAVPFYATTGPPGELSTLGNSEIVLVTALATDTATATRAQLGTTAKNIQAGWVFGNGVYVEDINPFNSVVVDETPVGTINGTNKVFVTAQPYIGATLEVFVNGLRQKTATHFVETTPTTGTFTFDDAPSTGDVVTVGYYFAVGSVSTNSDTVDGFNAFAIPTANSLLALDLNGQIPTAALGGAWASWTPTWTNLSGGTLQYAKYTMTGKTVKFRAKYTLAGAGVSGAVIFSLPFEAHADYAVTTQNGEGIGIANIRDAGTAFFSGQVSLRTTLQAEIRPILASGTYTSTIATSSTVPMTWANTDEIYIEGTYEAA